MAYFPNFGLLVAWVEGIAQILFTSTPKIHELLLFPHLIPDYAPVVMYFKYGVRYVSICRASKQYKV